VTIYFVRASLKYYAKAVRRAAVCLLGRVVLVSYTSNCGDEVFLPEASAPVKQNIVPAWKQILPELL
jgi:hypothetical protein